MVRIAEAEATEPTPEAALVAATRDFLRLKNAADLLAKEQKRQRDNLVDIVQAFGQEDESGNVWLDLPQEVEGVVALKHERRVSQGLDMQEAEDILKAKGLWDRCITMQPTINEVEVMEAISEGLLTEADIDAMFPKKVTYAFVPSKKR